MLKRMPITIQEYCKYNNLDLLTDTTTFISNNISAQNNAMIDVILTCGHEKSIKVSSSLANKNYKITYLTCSSKDKNGREKIVKRREKNMKCRRG